jgi:Arc/MetJ-type ribon-helix-helix transcriptional regulator
MVVAMNSNIHDIREKLADSEKITINLGFVDLGHIDLLVEDGFYSNRTDFIRSAIRSQLATHAEQSRKSIIRQTLELGLRHYSKADLEQMARDGGKLSIKVLGLVTIAPDVSPELARATIDSITILGAFHASREVKTALDGRIS